LCWEHCWCELSRGNSRIVDLAGRADVFPIAGAFAITSPLQFA